MPIPRAAVHSLIAGHVPNIEATYGSNSVDSPREQSFIVLHWETTTAAFGSRGTTVLFVWVHDRERDYTRCIDPALTWVRETLTESFHVLGDDGVTLTCATWVGESDDLFDDGYGTISRYAQFTIVAR